MTLKAALDERHLAPRKKWGQHFLTDRRILESIVAAADVTSTDCVLEIGPGLGHLTRVLAEHAGQVIAVEVDPGLAEKLTTDFAASDNVKILRGDVLEHTPSDWLKQAGVNPASSLAYKVVANLPYYITSAILRHLLEADQKPRVIVAMVQREVAARMTALPPKTNLLAVSVQFFASVRVMRKIAAGAFYPRPRVDSAVVRLDVIESAARGDAARKFFDVVSAGFGERRKQLRNSIAQGLGLTLDAAQSALLRAQIDPTRRAETLTLNEWRALARALTGDIEPRTPRRQL